ncbi:MAG: acetyltransferase [bacterium]
MKNDKPVIIFGLGDFAKLVQYYLKLDNQYKIACFTADREYIKEAEMCGVPTCPFDEIEKGFPPEKYDMFIAIGYSKMNKVRAEKYCLAKRKGYKLVTYISPAAIYHGDEIGENCLILDNIVVHPFVKIGNNVIMIGGGVVGHDSIIGDHCFLSCPKIAGRVTVKPYCFLGFNSIIVDNLLIERECFIGAGAIINKNTVENGVYAASAAKLRRIDSKQILIR